MCSAEFLSISIRCYCLLVVHSPKYSSKKGFTFFPAKEKKIYQTSLHLLISHEYNFALLSFFIITKTSMQEYLFENGQTVLQLESLTIHPLHIYRGISPIEPRVTYF